MAVDLKLIPAVMRAYNWEQGARLMELWFSLSPSVAPAYKFRNDSIVKMDWVLRYERAREVYDEMLRKRVWTTPAAKAEIKAMLKRTNRLGGAGCCFTVFQSTQQVIHQNAVQYQKVSQGIFDSLDGLAAALANFNFHVQVGGMVEPVAGSTKHRITITEVGIYVRDQYDFDGSQPLGYWDVKNKKVYKVPMFGAEEVTNADFRAWRTANHAGGDFLVFSDVKVTTVQPPDVFEE